MVGTKAHKGGIFGTKPKIIFRGSSSTLGRNKPKVTTKGVHVWDGGHEANTQDIRTSTDGRRFISSRTVLEVAKPSLTDILEDATMETHDIISERDDSEVHVVVREPKPAKRYFVSVSAFNRLVLCCSMTDPCIG